MSVGVLIWPTRLISGCVESSSILALATQSTTSLRKKEAYHVPNLTIITTNSFCHVFAVFPGRIQTASRSRRHLTGRLRTKRCAVAHHLQHSTHLSVTCQERKYEHFLPSWLTYILVLSRQTLTHFCNDGYRIFYSQENLRLHECTYQQPV